MAAPVERPVEAATHLAPQADRQVRLADRPEPLADQQAPRVGRPEELADQQVQRVARRPEAWADRQVLLAALRPEARRDRVATVALQAGLRHRWAVVLRALQVAKPEVLLVKQAVAQTALEQSRVVLLAAVAAHRVAAAAVRKAQRELPEVQLAVDRMAQMARARRPPLVAEGGEQAPQVKPEATVRVAMVRVVRPAVATVPRMDRAMARTAAVRLGPPARLAVAQQVPAAPMASPALAVPAARTSACLSHSPSSRRCSLRVAAVRAEVVAECLAAVAPDRPMAPDRRVEAAAQAAADR
jgi:hypothetical protein